jgi:hypothetical protein
MSKGKAGNFRERVTKEAKDQGVEVESAMV